MSDINFMAIGFVAGFLFACFLMWAEKRIKRGKDARHWDGPGPDPHA